MSGGRSLGIVFASRIAMRRGNPRAPGVMFHVWNRGVRRLRIFREALDYNEFLGTLRQAQQRSGMRVLAYALLPTHFHLVLWPAKEGQLSEFMSWLTATHTKRWHARHQTSGTGPVYQGRYSAKAIVSEQHLLGVCGYVENNPVVQGLVTKAEDWPWSSLSQRSRNLEPVTIEPWPLPQPVNWLSEE